MKNIAIFASGSGSNAETIVNYFRESDEFRVKLILTNNANAGIIARSRKLSIPCVVFSKGNFTQSEDIVELLKSTEIDLVVLAGFLWLIPENLIANFPNRILNIHPSLLPKYGGKGMWGHHVHQAVFDNSEKESGMTIHLVNEKYDEGEILFQARVNVENAESPEEIAARVLELEHKHYPRVIESYLESI